MAISDKVIDLAPVSKTKNIIIYITLGLLAALSVVFLVLYILKPNVVPAHVNSVTITGDSLYPTEDGYTASYMCVYSLEAQVGVTGKDDALVDTTVDWSAFPADAVYVFSEQEAAENDMEAGTTVEGDGESRVVTSRYNFRVIGQPGRDVRVVATSKEDATQTAEFNFKIVEGVTGEMTLDRVVGNGKTVTLDDGAALEVPYYRDKELTASNTYSIAVSQLGLGGVAQISGSTDYIKLEADSSDTKVANVISVTEKEVRFTVAGTGEAQITVKANAFNSAEEIVKTLTVRSKSTDESKIISKYWLYPDGNLPDKEPDYDKLTTSPQTLTIYLGDNFTLFDHVLVRPWARQSDFAHINNIGIAAEDNSIVRGSDAGDKVTLYGVKAGMTKVTITDRSANAAGAKLVLQVQVQMRVKEIKVTSPTVDQKDNWYTVAGYRAQKNGNIALSYTFDGTATGSAPTFNHTYTDCNLTVYAYSPDGSVAATPYDNSGAVEFGGLVKGIITVPNSNPTDGLPQITGNVGFSIKPSAESNTVYRYRFYAGAEPTKAGCNWFDVTFRVTTEPKGLAWVDSVPAGEGIAQFNKIEPDNTNPAVVGATLTINLGDTSPFSVEDLLRFTIDESGTVDESAAVIGRSRVTVIKHGNDYSIGTPASLTAKIDPLRTTSGRGNFIEVLLRDDNNKTIAQAYLYVQIVDNNRTAVVGSSSGSSNFTPQTDEIVQMYSSDSQREYNAQQIALQTVFYIYRQTWAGFYYAVTDPAAYSMHVRIAGSQTDLIFDPSTGYYYVEETDTDDPTKALFRADGGKLYACQDFFAVYHKDNNRNYSSFSVRYTLNDVEGDSGYTVNYNLRRRLDDVKLYTDSTFGTEETKNEDGSYALTRNQNELLTLYIAASFTYTDNGQQTVKLSYADVNLLAQQKITDAVKLGVISEEDGVKIATRQESDTAFRLRTGVTSGQAVRGSITYGVDGPPSIALVVRLEVRNMSAPIKENGIRLYKADEHGDKTGDALTGTTVLDSAASHNFYLEIDYSVDGNAYNTYESIAFDLPNHLTVSRFGSNVTITGYTPEGKPHSGNYTLTACFTVRAVGGRNGDANWVLHASGGRVSATYAFKVTTYMTAADAVEMTHDGQTVHSGGTLTLPTFTITNASGVVAGKVIAYSFRKDPDSAFEVDYDNYTLADVASTLFDVTWNKTARTITIACKGQVGSDTLQLIFKNVADDSQTYTVTVDVKAEAAVYSLDVMQGADTITRVDLTTKGNNETTDGSYAFTVRFNGGTETHQPAQTVKQSAAVRIDRTGGTGASQLTLSGDMTNGYTITYPHTVYSLDGAYKLVVSCGGVTKEIPIALSTTAAEVKFGATEAAVYHAGTYNFGYKIYKAGTTTETGLPAGYTLTFTLAGGDGIATVDSTTGALTVTGTAGTFKLTATLKEDGKVRSVAEMTVNVDNLVYYIVDGTAISGNGHQVNGNSEIWMVAGNTLDLATAFKLESFDHETPYDGADYAVTVSGGLTVNGKVLTAGNTAGRFTVTLTAANKDIAGRAITREIVVHVVKPTLAADQSTEIVNAVETTSLSRKITVNAGVGSGGTLTVTENGSSLFTVGAPSADGTVALTLNTDGLDLAGNKTANFTATYTLDGKTFTTTFTVTVKAEYTPTFKLMSKVGSTFVQYSGAVDTADTYRFDRADNAGTAKYTVAYNNKPAVDLTFNATDGFKFAETGNAVVTLTVTLYGKSFSVSQTFVVLNRGDLSAGVYNSGTFTEQNKITQIDGFYAAANARKVVYVVLDVSKTNATFTAADLEINTDSACVSVHTAASYNAATKKYVAAYYVDKAGTVTFYCYARVNGVWQSTSTDLTVSTSQDSPTLTADYKGGAKDPDTTIDLKSSSLDLTYSIASAHSAPAFAIVSGHELVESLSNGKLKFKPCTTGGSVRIRVSAAFTEGWFNGTTVTQEFDITVNNVAAPTVSLSSSNANVTLKYNESGTTLVKPTVSSGNATFAFACDATYATVDNNGALTLTAAAKNGSRFNVTVTATITSGAWKGLQLEAVYTVTVLPQVVAGAAAVDSVTAGDSIPLAAQFKLNGYEGDWTATFVSNDVNVAKVVNGSLVAQWPQGEKSVKVTATITITSGALAGVVLDSSNTLTTSLQTTVTVLGLELHNEGGNPATELSIYSGKDESVSAYKAHGENALTGVTYESSDTTLATYSNADGKIVIADKANIAQDGMKDADIEKGKKYVTFTVTYTEGTKTYKAMLTVVIPVTPAPIPTVAVTYEGAEQPSDTFTMTVGSSVTITLTPETNEAYNYTLADYTSAFVAYEDHNLFNVKVSQVEGGAYTLTLTAQSKTQNAAAVKILFVCKGYTYTAKELQITVAETQEIGSATLKNNAYGTNVEAKQLSVRSSYTYTFNVPNGSFQYINIQYDKSVVSVSTFAFKRGNSTVQFGEQKYNGANGEGNYFFMRSSYYAVADTCTFTVTAVAAGNPRLRVVVGNRYSSNYSDGYYISDANAVTAVADLATVSGTFTLAETRTIEATVGSSVSIYPELPQGFLVDEISYSVVNGIVSSNTATPQTATVTVRSAGVTKMQEVTVKFTTAPTIESFTYQGGQLKLTVTQDGKAFTDCSVVYAASTEEFFVAGTWNPDTGAFTLKHLAYAGNVRITATVTVNEGSHYVGLKLEKSVDIEVTAADEPTFAPGYDPTSKTWTLGANFTAVSFTSDNAAVTVDKNGKLTNTASTAQTAHITVVAKYTLAGDVYENRLYSETVTVENIAAAEQKPSFVPQVQAGKVTLPADFTLVAWSTDSDDVTIASDGTLVNASENAVTVNITVVARYTPAGDSDYKGDLFSDVIKDVSVDGVVPPVPETAPSVTLTCADNENLTLTYDNLGGGTMTVIKWASSNEHVTVVETDGNYVVTNDDTTSAQTATITVYVLFSKAGSAYDQRLYTKTVDVTVAQKTEAVTPNPDEQPDQAA